MCPANTFLEIAGSTSARLRGYLRGSRAIYKGGVCPPPFESLPFLLGAFSLSFRSSIYDPALREAVVELCVSFSPFLSFLRRLLSFLPTSVRFRRVTSKHRRRPFFSFFFLSLSLPSPLRPLPFLSFRLISAVVPLTGSNL